MAKCQQEKQLINVPHAFNDLVLMSLLLILNTCSTANLTCLNIYLFKANNRNTRRRGENVQN